MHPFNVKLGDRFPKVVPSVVEISKDSKLKYAVDPDSGMLHFKHALLSSSRYPANYGFVPQTISTDGDPVDMILICEDPLLALSIIETRPIGGLMLKSTLKGYEPKLLGVHLHDRQFGGMKSVDELPELLFSEIKQFFEDYRSLEDDRIKIAQVLNRKQAHEVLIKGHDRFEKEFSLAA